MSREAVLCAKCGGRLDVSEDPDRWGDRIRVVPCRKCLAPLKRARALAAKQAEDKGLWFNTENSGEQHLQDALRKLMEALKE
jgi:hypothetical protein